DLIGEAKVVERFDRSSLNAISLPQFQAAVTTLHQASVHIRVTGQGGSSRHPCWTGSNDQHVHGVGKFLTTIQAGAGGRLNSWLSGDISVMVKLHDLLLYGSQCCRKQCMFYI